MSDVATSRVQVLVVGAGPVGLAAALRLRRQGVDVRVVDRQSEHGAHSFPVVLHPQTLRVLQDLGVSEALVWRGRSVTTLAVYSDVERRAVLDLPRTADVCSGVLTLPQDVLRQALTSELERRGVSVEWNTSLVLLQQGPGSVKGRLSREAPTLALGSARARVSAFEADFVIGADGYDSTVRSALGVELVPHGNVQTFAFFDATTQRSGSEAQLVVHDDYCNAAYPLQAGQTRFSFQLGRRLNEPADLEALRELLVARMPWYAHEPLSCEWAGVAEFRSGLVDRFGVGRVWLAGEAAHLTGPLGTQSINIGIDEANELASSISAALAEPGPPAFGPHYERGCRRQWEQLLGLTDYAQVGARAPSWVRRHLNRLITAMPASGRDLDDLLAQLRLTPSTPPGDALP